MLDFHVVTRSHSLRPKLLILCSLLLVLAVLFGNSAEAQSCDAYVSVDGILLSGETACYFSAPQGPDNAYIRTDILTSALGLESSYLPDTGTLRFQKAGQTVDILATDDVEAALDTRDGALTVDSVPRAGPSAILAGSSYLPLKALVEAFGGTVLWNKTARMAAIDFSTAALMPPPVSPPDPSLIALGAPRYALHGDYTRVAIDIPAGVTYELATQGDNFIVLFRGARAETYSERPDGPQLSSLGFSELGPDQWALIVGTRYPIVASGRGFEVGRLGGEGSEETLYIDFAPSLRGEAVADLNELAPQPAPVRRPANIRKTVVIDPGHGGEDPGTSSEYVVEKDLVLTVGLLLRDELESRGINVAMTRDDDTFVELEDRARSAVPSEHNLFVSLHANSTEVAGAQGIETWVFGEPQDDSVIDLAVLENGGGEVGLERTASAQEEAASIDGDLLREENLAYSTILADTVQNDLVAFTQSENRGIRNNYFVVLRDARVPAVLVELGFVNSPVEGPKLADTHYQQTLAEALADGIEAFLSPGGTLADLPGTSN